MEDNNQVPKGPTKKEKAEQTGKDAAEVAGRGAANYFGGPVGGAIFDKVAQTKLGQKVLGEAGKTLAKNPVTKNGLAMAQPAMQKAKPMLNAAASSIGGGAGNAAKPTETSNPSTNTSNGANNSGFENSKSGLFSSSNKQDNKSSNNLFGGSKKSKGKLKIIAMISPVLFPMIICAVVAFVVIGQIMVIRDQIENLVKQFTTGIEKFVNFVQGDGWMTEEDSFFAILNKEFENFPRTGGENLDIALVAATIHYSTTVDLDKYEESEGSTEEVDTSSVPSGTLNEKDTVAFYSVAKDKLGSVNTIWPGQKRLLGHIVKTEITIEMIDVTSAGGYWSQFFSYFGQTYASTVEDAYWNTPIKYHDPLTAIADFIDTYEKAQLYVEEYGNVFYGLEYDAANLWYEAQEFVNTFAQLFESCKNSTTTNESGNRVPKKDKDGFFRIPAPVVTRTMNYGYDQYKQMKQDMIDMKSILSQNGVKFENDSDVLNHSKNSSNTELKKLYESYTKNSSDYRFSYVHYLQKVYIPFTYFYKKEYNQDQVDKIVDEIYDQRDLYYNLMGDKSDLTAGCGYSYTGDPVQMELNTDMLSNMYVNVLHYEETSRTSTNIAETVSLKDYVIGVIYREIGAKTTDDEEYLKANIIAIKSFTVGRPTSMGDPITNDGDKYYLTMRNNTNDQVYCSITKGCMDAPTNRLEAPSQELIDYVGRLYDEVANQFLYDSESNRFVGAYRDRSSTCAAAGMTGSCLGQVESKELGKNGESWETILATFYEDSIGIVDIETSTLRMSVMSCINPGLQLGHSGYSVRNEAPTSDNMYFIPPWNASSLGQCAWYAKGRALEIVDNINASSEKKELAINTIKKIFANGNQWYHEELLEIFAHSTDYTLPRDGAIVVYDWTTPKIAANGTPYRYGHVAIVEKVEGNTVYVSDGWNTCDDWAEKWECVGFAYRTVTIEQMKDLASSGYYKFIGYVYLLD